MSYPNQLVALNNGLIMYLPDEAQVKELYTKMKQEDAAISFPYWAKIWSSAKAMSLFLQKEPHWVEGKSVLEIGAGIGLPSFLIADIAKTIIISDYAKDAVTLIEKNIQYLQLKNATAYCLDWQNLPSNLSADIILLSDINYDPVQFESLLAMIQSFISKGRTIIVATPYRITAVPFAEQLQPYIKSIHWETIEEQNQSTDISIMILAK